jgi:hypothetical protein
MGKRALVDDDSIVRTVNQSDLLARAQARESNPINRSNSSYGNNGAAWR